MISVTTLCVCSEAASFFGELSSSDDDEDREQEDGDGLVYRYADSAEDDASHLADGNNADDFGELAKYGWCAAVYCLLCSGSSREVYAST